MTKRGFTLIELLIVIAIIAILAAAVIIAISPGQRLTEARESTRASHMASIGTAMHLAVVEYKDGNNQFVWHSVAQALACDQGIGDYNTLDLGEKYDLQGDCTYPIMATYPTDPLGGDYRISVDGTGSTAKVTVYPSTAGAVESIYADGVVY